MHEGLDIDQDIPYQLRAWRLQRIAWGLLALTLVAASLGLFGQGPWSDATVRQDSGNIRIDYERFLRYGRTTWLTISIADAKSDTELVEVLLERTYAEAATMYDSLPPPRRILQVPDGLRYEFPTSRGETEVVLRLPVSIQTVGTVTGRMRVGNSDWMQFIQFVYP